MGRLIRNLMAAESQKKTIFEVELPVALEQLGVTMQQFVDFCILCGCDYCDTIKGIGPANAIRLILEHGNIETILENKKESWKMPPEGAFNYKDARTCFL